MSIKELVKNNKVYFDSYRQGIFYYKLLVLREKRDYIGETCTYGTEYLFPIPVTDIGTATMLAEDKAIFFMRWIRKAIEDNTLIEQS